MNCLSSECESFCQSDLVFLMSGGAYSGKALPIKTQKCILAFDSNSGPLRSRCAIFRGEAGVTVRNLDSRVLVNGEVRNEHWLQKGDRIEFPNSIILEVYQLGCSTDGTAWQPQNALLTESVSPGMEFSSSEPDHTLTKSTFCKVSPESPLPDDYQSQDSYSDANSISNSTSSTKPEVPSDVLSCVENRFHDIEERLNQLTEQISSLVTLASCGKLSTTSLPESDWQKQVSNASIAAPGSTSAVLKNDDIEVTETTTFVPTNRFNAAEHFSASNSEKFAEKAVQRDQANLPLASAPEISSAVDTDALVPNRREPNELKKPLWENEATSTSQSVAPLAFSDTGLSELMASLSQKDGTLVPKTSRDEPAPDSFSDGTTRAEKFAASDPHEAASAAEVLSNSETLAARPSNDDPVNKPASVDDEIDRLLSRLFDAKSSTSSSDESLKQQGPGNPNLQSASSVESPEPVTAADSPDANTVNLNAGSPPEISYANMQFGYDLSRNETSADGVEPASDVTASNETPPAETVSMRNPVKPPADNEETGENVMDLLARLKQEGFLNFSEKDSADQSTIQGADNAETTSSQTEHTAPTDHCETPNAKPTTTATDSVEDYMNQLLARMNLGPDSHHDAKSKERTTSSNAIQAQPAVEDSDRGSELITAEEYVPKQKAAKIESFETMREIANTTARSAVEFSNLDRRKARGLMQTVIGIGALIMAAYYFLFVTEAFADTAFVVGAICLIITGGASYMAYNTFKGTGILKDLFPKSNGKI